MTLPTGTRIGPYEITGRIGAGGMGEVFRARDTRMGRDVAVKVLPEDVAGDAERLRRFEQEARAAGSLNHPNLVTIHDIGSHENAPYLVMELLEGDTLREKLGDTTGSSGVPRIPIRKAMDYAQQLASGLAAAHEKGIVHRDLKPDNVFVTRDGRLKLLDFGLAKFVDHSSGNGDETADATRARNTSPGTILGTVGYMSPEQVRGQDTDHRTDIFSAGAILYEMVAGRRAFRGQSAADTMSAILQQDPPEISSSAAHHVSPIVDRVIRRCLEKEREQRFESARDLGFAIEAVTSSGSSHEQVAVPAVARPRSVHLGLALLAMLLTAAIAAAVAYRAGRGSEKVAPQFSTTQLTFDAGRETSPAISPDGKTFVYAKAMAGMGRQLLLQRVDGRSTIALSRSASHDDRDPAFSPDGSQIAFRSERDGGGIFVMGATGESVRRLTSTGFNPAWSPDGREIIFASEDLVSPTSRNSISTLSIVTVATGAVRKFFAGDAMQPSFSPNGKRILFWGLPPKGGQRDIFTVAVSGDPKSVVAATMDAPLDWNAVWAPDGRSILFSSDRGGTMNLWRLGIDEETGQPRGQPQPLAVPATWAGHLSISRDGSHLVYVSRTVTESRRLGTFDPVTERVTFEETPLLSGSMLIRNAEPSPDGQWIAFSTEGRQEDIFVVRSDGSELRQLTNDIDRDRGVSWTPDGAHIIFYSTRAGDYDTWSVRTDGSELRQLTDGFQVNFPNVSPDGKRLYLFDLADARIANLDGVTMATEAETLPRLPGGDGFFANGWSPDGTKLVGTGWSKRVDLIVYTLADKTYKAVVSDVFGALKTDDLFQGASLRVSVKWIDDRRVLMSTAHNNLTVVDVTTKQVRVVAPVSNVLASRNGRTLLAGGRQSEADIWMLKLKE